MDTIPTLTILTSTAIAAVLVALKISAMFATIAAALPIN